MKKFLSLFALLFCFAAYSPPTFAHNESTTAEKRACIDVAIQSPAIAYQVSIASDQFAGVTDLAYVQADYTYNATGAILPYTDRYPKRLCLSTKWRISDEGLVRAGNHRENGVEKRTLKLFLKRNSGCL